MTIKTSVINAVEINARISGNVVVQIIRRRFVIFTIRRNRCPSVLFAFIFVLYTTIYSSGQLRMTADVFGINYAYPIYDMPNYILHYFRTRYVTSCDKMFLCITDCWIRQKLSPNYSSGTSGDLSLING